MDNTVKNILLVFLFVLIFYLMSVLSSLLIPLVLALLFATLFQPLILKINKTKFPNWFTLPIIIIISLAVLYGLMNILITSISQISNQQEFLLAKFSNKLNSLIVWFDSITRLDITTSDIIKEIQSSLSTNVVSSTLSNIASGLGSLTGSFFMFAIYYIVFIGGMVKSESYIKHISGDKQKLFLHYFNVIQSSIIKYILIKALISLTTAVLVYSTCILFGLKFAILWGFFTFILNFIPSIGSIIATIPPVFMAFIQFESLQPVFFLLLIISVIQFSVGNLIEPKIMGNRLKINTITVIFGLLFWGFIWGIPGMLLSVPLLVIIKLIFEHIPSLNIVAKIMSSPEKRKGAK